MDFSFQLYSARNLTSITGFFPRLKALGYAQLEGFGGLYDRADDLAAALEENQLIMPSGHFDLDTLKDTAKSMKIAETLGIKRLICPFLPPDRRTDDESGWLALAETLAGLAETYRAAGFGFGWHNHDYEFRPTRSGKLPLELILDTAPALEWECDVAWVVRGHHDPIAWIERYAERVTAVHVKDIAPAGTAEDEDGWADVGEGIVDWTRIFAFIRRKTNADLFIMEHDNPSNVERFAKRSIEYCQALGAKGK